MDGGETEKEGEREKEMREEERGAGDGGGEGGRRRRRMDQRHCGSRSPPRAGRWTPCGGRFSTARPSTSRLRPHKMKQSAGSMPPPFPGTAPRPKTCVVCVCVSFSFWECCPAPHFSGHIPLRPHSQTSGHSPTGPCRIHRSVPCCAQLETLEYTHTRSRPSLHRP